MGEKKKPPSLGESQWITTNEAQGYEIRASKMTARLCKMWYCTRTASGVRVKHYLSSYVLQPHSFNADRKFTKSHRGAAFSEIS